LDITTKMHVALAIMLAIYIAPLAYLVWLARQKRTKPQAQSKPDLTKKR
jgi:hypothetical protein